MRYYIILLLLHNYHIGHNKSLLESGAELLLVIRIVIIIFYCWQHTPRVNGKIPDVDNATLDHERLLERFSLSLSLSLWQLMLVEFGLCYTTFHCDFAFFSQNFQAENLWFSWITSWWWWELSGLLLWQNTINLLRKISLQKMIIFLICSSYITAVSSFGWSDISQSWLSQAC